MTPQLQQAIKMLQLSNLELTNFIDSEIQQNPLLERRERDLGENTQGDYISGGESVSPTAVPEMLTGEFTPDAAEHWQPEWGEDGDRPVDLGGEPQPWRSRDGGFDAPGRPGLEQTATRLRTLRDHLLEQIGADLGDQGDRVIALHLLDLLDDLPLVAARNIPALVRVCNVDAVDVHEMIREIQSLDPQPGLAFDPPLAQPVVPDILMRAQPKGGWIVELNGETLPRVLVNKSYYAQVCRATRHKAEKDYLIERLHAANWLVKSLHQRAITILKVAAEIVRQQDAFFRRGVPSLRPLILRDIADAIGMHESTISRVTSNKYMATPRGLYELKYFFTSAIPASGGNGAHSAEAVRHRIRALISGEPPDGTFSDERIVELLHYEGVVIKRRTVAKYREAMRIPSSVRRRRETLLAVSRAR